MSDISFLDRDFVYRVDKTNPLHVGVIELCSRLRKFRMISDHYTWEFPISESTLAGEAMVEFYDVYFRNELRGVYNADTFKDMLFHTYGNIKGAGFETILAEFHARNDYIFSLAGLKRAIISEEHCWLIKNNEYVIDSFPEAVREFLNKVPSERNTIMYKTIHGLFKPAPVKKIYSKTKLNWMRNTVGRFDEPNRFGVRFHLEECSPYITSSSSNYSLQFGNSEPLVEEHPEAMKDNSAGVLKTCEVICSDHESDVEFIGSPLPRPVTPDNRSSVLFSPPVPRKNRKRLRRTMAFIGEEDEEPVLKKLILSNK